MQLITLDIGNTHNVFGIWDNKKLVWVDRHSNKVSTTSDEWKRMIISFFQKSLSPETDFSKVKVIYSSVVPDIDSKFESALSSLKITEILKMNASLRLPFTFDYPNKSTLGADRLANAAGGVLFYGKNLLIVDFGTAITFCLVLENVYYGGAIVPGIEMALNSLASGTAMLPRVSYKKPFHLPGRSTTDSIISGIHFGWEGLIKNIIYKLLDHAIRIKKLKNKNDIQIIATGGISEKLFFNQYIFDIIDIHLILKGLMGVFYYNRKK